MKIFAYLCNVSFIIFLVVVAFTEKSSPDGKGLMIFTVFLALPVVNLIALATSGNGRDFLSLYFEVKRLEQEQKIIAIKKSMRKEI